MGFADAEIAMACLKHMGSASWAPCLAAAAAIKLMRSSPIGGRAWCARLRPGLRYGLAWLLFGSVYGLWMFFGAYIVVVDGILRPDVRVFIEGKFAIAAGIVVANLCLLMLWREHARNFRREPTTGRGFEPVISHRAEESP